MREEARRGELDAALADADRAFQGYAKTDIEWAWRFRVQKAHILVLRGSLNDALQLLNDALPPSLDRSDTAVRRRMVQGLAHDFSQQFNEAVKDLNDAEEIARLYQPALLGDIAQARGTLEVDRKRYGEAAAAFRTSLSIARQQELPFLEVLAFGSLGNVAMQQEHFDEAVDWYRLALQKSQSIGAASSLAITLGNIGWNYSALGDFENAETMLKEAESAASRAGQVGVRVYWLVALGDVYYRQRRYADAEAISLQALALARNMDSKRTVTECLNTLSEIALATDRLDVAERYNREASKIERSGLDQFGILYSLLVSGRIEAAKHHLAQAEDIFQTVIRDPAVETALRWEAQARLAKVCGDEGQPTQAEKEYRKAIGTIEAARASVSRDEFRLTFLSSAIEFYDDYVDFLIAQGRPDDALKVAELSRARTLTDGLASTTEAASLATSRVRPQHNSKELNALLLFYWVGHEHSYLWAITPTKTTYFSLPKAADIEPLVKSYRKTILGMRDAQDADSSEGKQLYAMLVEPAKKLIPKGSRVILLPAESLYGLNFETLVVPDPMPHFWIEDVTLTTASSLTLLAASATQPPPKTKSLLLVGNTEQPSVDFPVLRQAPAEMKNVSRYFPDGDRKVLEGKQATPSAYLASNPERFSYLHFVTHGTASHTRPLESAVILSREGDSYKLYARDIVQHHLNASLVTISACNGSGTRAYSGEGLVGLSWAFLRAGAHNVIGALWEVSDASTPQLMDSLYGELDQGKDPATALRDAKLRFLHSPDPTLVFKKPFYWAPFQLYAGS